ncbi:MAG: DUF1707 domain-containing protein [Sciscionella sp.]
MAFETQPEGGAGLTWQDEYRKLDEDLASGKLSAEEYRTRRDQVLQSSTSTTHEPPSAAETQTMKPVGPPEASPDRDSQRHTSASPNPPDADVSGERTQVVPGWQTQPESAGAGTQNPRAGAHRQQPPASYGYGQQGRQPNQPNQPGQQNQGGQQNQPGQQPSWNQPSGDANPPWEGAEFPPLAAPSHSNWIAAPGDGFDSAKPSGKGKRILLSGVGVLVVVAIGLVVWLLFIKPGGGQQANAGPNPSGSRSAVQTRAQLPEPPPVKPAPANDDAALVDPPGAARAGGGRLTLSKVESGKLLPTAVIAALKQGGMTSGALKTSTDGPSTVGLFALAVRDPQAAVTVANAYGIVQRGGGVPTDKALSLDGVEVFSNAANQANAVRRAVYVLYNRVIIVEAFGKQRAAVDRTFSSVLTKQVALAPPTKRGS